MRLLADPARVGFAPHLPPLPGFAPGVDWLRADLDDHGPFVTAASIRRDYRSHDDPRLPLVYPAFLPISLFSPCLWEEAPSAGGGETYDWSRYTEDGRYPPIKVLLRAQDEPHVLLADGNHRLFYWKSQGFLLAPAWVLDYGISQDGS